MKNLKIFLVIFMALFATASFAAWSQPTATPPNGNTLPPINVGTVKQEKQGIIGAKKFCITGTNYCLGQSGLGVGVSNEPSGGGAFCLAGICISNWSDLSNNPFNFVKGSGVAGQIAVWTSGNTIGGTTAIQPSSITLAGDTITSWPTLINTYGVSRIIKGSGITITPPSGKGEVTISTVPVSGSGDVGPGTITRISKFTSTNKIGDSNVTDSGSMVEVTAVPLKASNGLIIPKTTTDVNGLEEGAIWLNTSVIIP